MYREEAPIKLQLAPVTWNALPEHFLVTTNKNKGTGNFCDIADNNANLRWKLPS